MSLTKELRDYLDMNDNGNDAEVQRGIFLLAALGCKHLLVDTEREHAIEVTDDDFRIGPNIFYECWRELYNWLGNDRYKEIMGDDIHKTLVRASRTIAGNPVSGENKRRASRHVSMISEEIKSLYKNNRFKVKDDDLCRAITAAEVVFRELFIRLRSNLSGDQYRAIPVDLSIGIGNDLTLVRDLFTEDARHNRYKLNIQLSKYNRRRLQLLIGRYMIRSMR